MAIPARGIPLHILEHVRVPLGRRDLRTPQRSPDRPDVNAHRTWQLSAMIWFVLIEAVRRGVVIAVTIR